MTRLINYLNEIALIAKISVITFKLALQLAYCAVLIVIVFSILSLDILQFINKYVGLVSVLKTTKIASIQFVILLTRFC